MKNNIYIIGFLWCFLGGSSLLYAQSRPIPTGLDYTYLTWLSEEKEAKLYCTDTACQDYLDTLEHLSCQHDCYLDGFYPIGWSRAGAFAYVHYKNNGVQLTDYEIKVVDSPKRKIKNQASYATSFIPVEDFEGISDLWGKKQKDIERLLRDNQIQSVPTVFHPISLAEEKLTLRKNRSKTDQTIDSYELILHANGNEVVLSRYKQQARANRIKQIKIVGWVPSPYTSKVAIIMAYEEIVAPSITNYTFRLVVVNW
jgi:hypothetical protein